MKGGAKCRKWGGLGFYGALKVMGNANSLQIMSVEQEFVCNSFGLSSSQSQVQVAT